MKRVNVVTCILGLFVSSAIFAQVLEMEVSMGPFTKDKLLVKLEKSGELDLYKVSGTTGKESFDKNLASMGSSVLDGLKSNTNTSYRVVTDFTRLVEARPTKGDCLVTGQEWYFTLKKNDTLLYGAMFGQGCTEYVHPQLVDYYQNKPYLSSEGYQARNILNYLRLTLALAR